MKINSNDQEFLLNNELDCKTIQIVPYGLTSFLLPEPQIFANFVSRPSYDSHDKSVLDDSAKQIPIKTQSRKRADATLRFEIALDDGARSLADDAAQQSRAHFFGVLSNRYASVAGFTRRPVPPNRAKGRRRRRRRRMSGGSTVQRIIVTLMSLATATPKIQLPQLKH